MAGSNRFAVVHTWPDLRNAEYEVLQRILGAAERIGARAVVVDRSGTVIWTHPEIEAVEGETLAADAVDFLIALHFESARVLDIYSYITLWQPIDFYHTFGYQKSIDKLTSYNDLLSCESDLADAHGRNLLCGIGRMTQLPLPKMFHSLPEPFLAPRTDATSRLFYIGVNWERLGAPRGRFHDTLITLEKQGLVDIYGPELVNGVAPWQDFVSYKGEIPFDGVSVKRAINRAGICLVLSSASHKHAGIMSNRLFEGLAGGAAIIATPHALIDKHFRDCVYLVDDTHGAALLGREIVEAVREIREDPAEARRRTLEGQRILRENFSLETSLHEIIEQTASRAAYFDAMVLASSRVTVILTYKGSSVETLRAHLRQFRKQKRCRVILELICDERFAQRHGDSLVGMAGESLESIALHPASLSPAVGAFDGPQPSAARTGPETARILKHVGTPYFAFSTLDDEVFSDHFASLAKVLEEQPDAALACCGAIVHSETADRQCSRVLESARFVNFNSIVLVAFSEQAGRFLFRTTLVDDRCAGLMFLLDGEEHSYFRLAGFLAGPLAQTNYATYVMRQPSRVPAGSAEPVEHQRQYIRDYFARDPRWLKALSTGVGMPEFVYAYSPGTPVRFNDHQKPTESSYQISVDEPLAVRAGGDGLRCLVSGFSSPESEHVWIEGPRGVLEFTVGASELGGLEDYTLVLSVAGRRAAATGRLQHVTIAVNGMVISYATVPETVTDLVIALPRALLEVTRSFRVEITPDHSEVVYGADGSVVDARRLSVGLYAIEVRRVPEEATPLLSPGVIHRATAGYPGATALLSNFHLPEADLTWIAGRRALLSFRLTDVPSSPELRIRLAARMSIETGRWPTATFTVNGIVMPIVETTASQADVVIDCSGVNLRGKSLCVVIEASHAEAVFDATHTIIDNRLLGLGVVSFGVFEGAATETSAPPGGEALAGGPSGGWDHATVDEDVAA